MTDHARTELFATMRTLNAALVDAELDDAGLSAVIERLQDLVDMVGSYGSSRWWQRSASSSGYERNSPFRGSHHPTAPQMELIEVAGPPNPHMRATTRIGSLFEGPPGAVHGGMIAAIFDEVLAATQSALGPGRSGRTALLTIRYRVATPTNTDMTIDAWVVRATGRRSTLKGTIRVDGATTATAEALFVRPNPSSP